MHLFRARSDFEGAVEMLCLSGNAEEAVNLAEESQQASALAHVRKLLYSFYPLPCPHLRILEQILTIIIIQQKSSKNNVE